MVLAVGVFGVDGVEAFGGLMVILKLFGADAGAERDLVGVGDAPVRVEGKGMGGFLDDDAVGLVGDWRLAVGGLGWAGGVDCEGREQGKFDREGCDEEREWLSHCRASMPFRRMTLSRARAGPVARLLPRSSWET